MAVDEQAYVFVEEGKEFTFGEYKYTVDQCAKVNNSKCSLRGCRNEVFFHFSYLPSTIFLRKEILPWGIPKLPN